MPTQRLIIAKIGGKSASVVLDHFREWHAARNTDDPDLWWHKQWPASVKRQADKWADSLRQNCHEPPVLSFVEYVDLWSMCPPYLFFRDHGLIQIETRKYQLFCIELPLNAAVLAKLEKARKRGQYPEDRLFAALTLNAASAWQRMVDCAILVFLRQTIAGAKSDDDITASLSIVPKWME